MTAPIAAVVGVLLLLGTAVQTLRLHHAQNATEAARLETAECRLSLRAAAVDSAQRAAGVATKVRENYVQTTERDAPVVERVVTRVRNICVRDDTGTDRDPALPGTAGLADDRAGSVADDGDRAFAIAIGQDLEVCSRELERMRALQDWVQGNR